MFFLGNKLTVLRIVCCVSSRLLVKPLMAVVSVVMQQKERSQIILIEIRGSTHGNNGNTHKYLVALINKNRLEIFREPKRELRAVSNISPAENLATFYSIDLLVFDA